MVTNSMERTFAIESVPNWEDGDVRVYLSGLSSLLEVRDEHFFFFNHAFFMDFLRDPERAREYRIDVRRSILSSRAGDCKLLQAMPKEKGTIFSSVT